MRDLFYKILEPFSAISDESFSLKVLAYHEVPDREKFQNQLEYLRDHYAPIDLTQLRNFFERKATLPKNAVLITFDDGDISVYDNGLPVLRKLDLPAVLFVITGLINTTDTFWCRKVEKFYEKEGKSYMQARSFVNHLKSIPEKQRLELLENIPDCPPARQLSDAHLKEFQSSKVVVANHTHSHPMLDNCNEIQIRSELAKSKAFFEKLGFPESYEVFAYPNGNWDSRVESILMDEGIQIAFLFDHGVNTDLEDLNPVRISRIKVGADDKLAEFKVKISGLHSKIMKLRNSLLA